MKPTEEDNRGQHAGLDDTDRAIITFLQADGRTPYRKIARDLGISEGTVRSRVAKLEESGTLTITAVVDPSKVKGSVQGFCLINAVPGMVESVIRALQEWDEVAYVSSCIGSSEIYAQLICSDLTHLSTLLHKRLGHVEGVANFQSFLEVKTHKVSYRQNLLPSLVVGRGYW